MRKHCLPPCDYYPNRGSDEKVSPGESRAQLGRKRWDDIDWNLRRRRDGTRRGAMDDGKARDIRGG